jgi:hypothetical protein
MQDPRTKTVFFTRTKSQISKDPLAAHSYTRRAATRRRERTHAHASQYARRRGVFFTTARRVARTRLGPGLHTATREGRGRGAGGGGRAGAVRVILGLHHLSLRAYATREKRICQRPTQSFKGRTPRKMNLNPGVAASVAAAVARTRPTHAGRRCASGPRTRCPGSVAPGLARVHSATVPGILGTRPRPFRTLHSPGSP